MAYRGGTFADANVAASMAAANILRHSGAGAARADRLVRQ